MDFTASESPRPGLVKALPRERCNFHKNRQAVVSYVGTPLCEQCVGRLP